MSQASIINFAIDPNQHEIWGSGGAFITESGKYPMVIVGAVYEPTTSNPNNWKLTLSLKIIAGKLKDKEITTSLNIAHTTDSTREAAMKQLTSFCTAMGVSQAWNDAAVLYNKPFQAYIEATQETSSTDKNKSYWKNELKNWFYPNGEPIQQGVFAAGALLTVVYNGDSPVVPNAGATIAPPAQNQPQTGNPAAGAYGNGAPAVQQQQQTQQQYADPNAAAAGSYGGQPQQQQQQHSSAPPAFNGGGPAGAPNTAGGPAFNGGATTGGPNGGFGTPPNFNR